MDADVIAALAPEPQSNGAQPLARIARARARARASAPAPRRPGRRHAAEAQCLRRRDARAPRCPHAPGDTPPIRRRRAGAGHCAGRSPAHPLCRAQPAGAGAEKGLPAGVALAERAARHSRLVSTAPYPPNGPRIASTRRLVYTAPAPTYPTFTPAVSVSLAPPPSLSSSVSLSLALSPLPLSLSLALSLSRSLSLVLSLCRIHSVTLAS